ncbi:MAG: baseplate J/gp47 family protein [Gammaproteobacteria bacterium]|nr:baseplate J/gp47 family protein [Gammaproteobacteria bacterium]NNJ83630.1 baseplate assembly protein [Gammaproteobacteria bacterium]
MSMFTKIDLSKLPPPDVVESLSYETILNDSKATLAEIDPQFDGYEWRESEPLYKLLQVFSYREMYVRQRINEAARNVMLATATGSNLDHLAALFSLSRQELDPGDPEASPPIPATLEEDESLRSQVQMAFEGFSCAGSQGAYEFYARQAFYEGNDDEDEPFKENVKDISVDSPDPGVVDVFVLSDRKDGLPSDGLIAAVEDCLNAEEVRPITDEVRVKKAGIIEYAIWAQVTVSEGVGIEETKNNAEAQLQHYTVDHHNLGDDITISGIHAALHQAGVRNVTITQLIVDGVVYCDAQTSATSEDTPLVQNITVGDDQSAYCNIDPDDPENYGLHLTFKES